MTTTGAAPGTPSDATIARPRMGVAPSTGKNSAVARTPRTRSASPPDVIVYGEARNAANPAKDVVLARACRKKPADRGSSSPSPERVEYIHSIWRRDGSA